MQHSCNHLLKTTLTYFNRDKSVIVQTSASEYGIGVALLQNGHPVAFTSKSLTDVESKYANKERVCLSVCYAMAWKNCIGMSKAGSPLYKMITSHWK